MSRALGESPTLRDGGVKDVGVPTQLQGSRDGALILRLYSGDDL